MFILCFFLKQHYVTLSVMCSFEKPNLMMHVNTPHKATFLVKLGHILQRKCPLVFPLMSSDSSVCLQPLILAEWSTTAACCCSCSFSLQAAHMLLSGTSVNHRVEAEWSEDIRGKTRGHFFCNIWPGFTKISVLCNVWTCIIKFRFSELRFMVKVT